MPDNIKANAYLVLKYNKKQGYNSTLSVKATKNKPSTASDEIAVKIQLDVPKALFTKPAYEAHLTIDESSAPTMVIADLKNNIEEVLRERLNLSVSVSGTSCTVPDEEEV